MKRLENIYMNIKELEKNTLPRSNLNIEDYSRMIKNSLESEGNRTEIEENKNKRRLKGNVALPELSHLNVNKFK